MRWLLLLALLPFATAADSPDLVITDLQGAAHVRPVGHERWTPVGIGTRLQPGDLLRTPPRGANAVQVRIGEEQSVLLGPGAMVEMNHPVRLVRGEAEMNGADVYRVVDGQPTRLENAPRWLTGYRESTTDEWMGSLLATVDGRDVPLSIGYHKVSVDIRDQIARTTVEQSFVNATDQRLEGVFYFPLPAGASVSGFGMWIGGELVEADIVERQRARAIYEEILRRKDDPGLLEWSGGNLFKASVFPIEPNAEKRIRIRYTQVLPLEGNRLRYRYALRSELLQRRPVRELGIQVRVSSASPIKAIASPSHTVRARHTAHAGSAEFDAQEFRPQRDFELVLELVDPPPLTVIPHRRGEDGYFMVLFQPPGGKQDRELLPETGPLDLILLADTSASMDRKSRAAQREFLDALIGMLGPKDRFRLLAGDATVAWLKDTDELDRRPSLGWTDLPLAFETALDNVSDQSVFVYVGDGIGTTGDADPVAIAKRIGALTRGRNCHAVAVSSTYEQGVLEAIGSMRETRDDPAAAAESLLREIAQPALTDAKLVIEGARTARIYPDPLPNLPAGKQQVILGRFDPEGEQEQRGRVALMGVLDGMPVLYEADLVLSPGEEGNSFLPRLWARHHLDALLKQGDAHDEIIDFSERYGIMTPYTSLLVLESDADRERYGVKRRVKMRDGERFFVDGSDQARNELRAQQMVAARAWRLDLRRRVLRDIGTLGRERHSAPSGWDYDYRAEVPLFGGQAEESGEATIYMSEPLAPFFTDEGLREPMDPEFDDYESYELGDTGVDLRGLTDFAPPLTGFNDTGGLSFEIAPMTPQPYGAFGDSWSDGDWGAWSPGPEEYGFPHIDEPIEAEKRDHEPDWPAQLRRLIESIDRRPALHAFHGGVEVRLNGESIHRVRGTPTGRYAQHGLFGAAGWFTRSEDDQQQQPMENWCAHGEFGTLDASLRLGRKRVAVDSDRDRWKLELEDLSWTDLIVKFGRYRLADWLESGGRIILTLEERPPGTHGLRLAFDRRTGDLVEWADLDRGKPFRTVQLEDFIEAAGSRWARKIRIYNHGRLVVEEELEVTALDAAEYRERLDAALAGQQDVIFLGAEDRDLDEAKQAAFEGGATFVDWFRLARDAAGSQRWNRMHAHWDRAKALLRPDQPGAKWIHAAILAPARRGEAFLRLMTELADDIDSPFLARFLLELAPRGLAPEEQLHLWNRTQPVFEDAPGSFLSGRARLLETLDRYPEARQAWRLAFEAAPRDIETIGSYVDVLNRLHRREQARSFLKDQIALGGWDKRELGTLYSRLVDLLWESVDIEEIERVSEEWIAADPESDAAWARRLTSWLLLGEEERADRWVLEQIESEDATQRAAVRFARGNGWNFWTNLVTERWQKPLGELVLRLLRQERGDGLLADEILRDGGFELTDAYLQVRRELISDLSSRDRTDAMPLKWLQRYFDALRDAPRPDEGAAWARIAGNLEKRWAQTTDKTEIATLGRIIASLLDDPIEFRRRMLKRVASDDRSGVAAQLLEGLARLDWTQAIESEMLALVPVAESDWHDPEFRFEWLGGRTRGICDQLFRMRAAVSMGTELEQEQLTRKERATKRSEAREQARRDLAERLADIEGQPWFELERLGYAAEAGGDAVALERELTALSKAPHPKCRSFELRCNDLFAYLATRSKAPDDLVERVLERASREETVRLLIALDRTEELETLLRGWISPDLVQIRWRVALGYLLAEKGDLAGAIGALEEAAALDSLDPKDYAALADWQLAAGRAEEAGKTREIRYASISEWRLVDQLDRMSWGREEDAPVALDPEAPLILRSLLTRASDPAHRTWHMQILYERTKDHRLLGCLAAGVLGHSPGAIYPYLEDVASILRQVHEEATCDEVIRSLEVARENANTDTDRRGMLFLETLVERRASEVIDQPGPHVERALAALRAVAEGDWQPGERRAVSRLLASMGAIPHESLALEQKRLLRVLLRDARAPRDRFQIALNLANVQMASKNADAAIETLGRALDEARAHQGSLRDEFGTALGELIEWMVDRKRYADAERRAGSELVQATDEYRAQSCELMLAYVYEQALRNKAELSVGKGERLYLTARARSEELFGSIDRDRVGHLLDRFCQLHVAAKIVGIKRSVGDFERFAETRLPTLALRLPSHASGLLAEGASALYTISGHLKAVNWSLDRIESEPRWWGRSRFGSWSSLGFKLAVWRTKDAFPAELEERLLAVTLAELRRVLSRQQGWNQLLNSGSDGHFWKEKIPAFAGVAREVVQARPESAACALYAARYLGDDLKLMPDAIEMLQAADRRGAIESEGLAQLADYLQEQERFEEMLPVLKRLRADDTDNLRYQLQTVVALHRCDRDEEALETLLHDRDELSRFGLAEVAGTALDCGFHEQAAEMFVEVIARAQRNEPKRGVGGSLLTEAYDGLAHALSMLDRSEEALDAAAAAIVAWGPEQEERSDAIETLNDLVEEIEDLDEFVAKRDAEAEASGLDSPLMRRAIGLAYLAREDKTAAAVQLRAALALDPTDLECHQILVGALEGPAAIEALWEAIAAAPLELELYTELAHRLGGDARRAETSLAEVKPHEAEGHRLLAERWEKSKRFEEAATQWRQVIRVRTGEPDGWLGLARCQVALGDSAGARETLRHLEKTRWPERFDTVEPQVRALEKRLR